MERIDQGSRQINIRLLGRLDEVIGHLKDPGTPRHMIVPFLEQIQSLISLFEAHPSGRDAPAPADGSLFRHEVINRLQVRHALVIFVAEDLETYMNEARNMNEMRTKKVLDILMIPKV